MPKTILQYLSLLFVLLCAPAYLSASLDTVGPLFTRAENGDVNAQSYVAHLYATGKGVEQDYNKACYWYQRILKSKNADAKIVAHANLLLGVMYTTGKGVGRSYQKAMQCYMVAADQGYSDAHISIGYLYAEGLGVQQDYHKALHWWELAKKEGHPKATRLLNLLKKEMSTPPSG